MILDGYGKYKRYLLTDEGYKLCSQWTNSNTVEFEDGKTAQNKLGAIDGITDSLTATSPNVALSAAAGKNLQDQVTQLNTGMIKDISLTGDVTGTSVVDEETGKAEIETRKKRAIAYVSNTTGGWYQVATITTNKSFQDYNIIFLVEKTYSNDRSFGILKITFRMSPDGIASNSITLECTNIPDPSVFVLTHKENESGTIEWGIWVLNTRTFQGVLFTVLSESTGNGDISNLFTLRNYKGSGFLSEIPSECTQITCTLATIQNPVERALLADAVNGISRYESGSGTDMLIPFYPGKRYLCAASMLGGNGVNGYSPVVFILEFPYHIDDADPKIIYVFRTSENYVIDITKEDNQYRINVRFSTTKMAYATMLMLNIRL